jgi:hypothetical protein
LWNGFAMKKKFYHLGIPATETKEGEIYLPHLKMMVADYEKGPHKTQWMRFQEDALYPKWVPPVPPLAFEVDDLAEAIKGQKVIVEPNFLSEGLTVALLNTMEHPLNNAI